MMEMKILEEIGLTNSEIRVYIALLKLGTASKGPLVKESGITSSKIYEVTDKLIEKGLVSYFLKNNVKYFRAAQPSRIRDYIREKKQRLTQQEKEADKIIPLLNQNFPIINEENKAEVFEGWKGLETVFEDIIKTLKAGEEDLSFGASSGEDPQKSRFFYDKYLNKTHEKGIKIRTIMNAVSKEYFKSSKAKKSHVKVKYLDQTTPSEINIYANKTVIIILKKKPLAVLIKGKEVADSFKQYFETMWKIASYGTG